MEISKFDLSVLVVMSLAIISMSFVFPAIGLADTSASESDIPDLEVQEDRFRVAQDRPNFPNTATEGTLEFNTTKDAAFSDNQIYLENSSTSAVTLALVQNSTTQTARVVLTVFNSTSVVEQDSYTFGPDNTSAVLDAGQYRIAVETTADNNPPDYLEAEWNVAEQGATDSWIGRIPGVGALFATADLVASVLAWGITVFIWFATSAVFGAINLIGVIVDVSVWFISMLSWLITTYGSVIYSAPTWTGIFVATPGILLSGVLAKIVVIIFRSLPTT
jgi:hypothetical protein